MRGAWSGVTLCCLTLRDKTLGMTGSCEFVRNLACLSTRKAAVAAAFAVAFTFSAHAEETGSAVVSGGGVVEFSGASATNWVYNADTSSYDFILTFANSAAAGSFTLPGTTAARILAVGGGGGGGGTYAYASANQPYGGGGGGGGGSLVETNDLFGAGTYSVAVGVGGAGGVRDEMHSDESDYSGKDGGDTAILTNGVSFVTAYGGGGGGGETAGHNGGSGGGGSKKYLDSTSSGVNNAGGSGISGQGYAGGAGDANNYGGGGGGAGGAGSPASASVHGVGGAGKTSDITGESVSYAPGGGGGCNNRNATEPSDGVAGGNNDEHGRGGVGRTVAPTAGQDGIGGGGGGANRNTAGAKGGDGVVIVRIAASLTGGLDKPTDVVYEYDGTSHTSYSTTAFYAVTGDNVATEVGTYVAVVTPAPGIKWTDGTSDSVTVVMTIKAAGSFDGNVEITGAPVSFAGVAATNWIDGDLLIKFTGAGSFTLPGTTAARILAVGGGGGGGGTYAYASANQPYGGGGGGGGGSLVETNDLFGAGTYSVAVGVGGAGGVRDEMHSDESDYSGKDGGDTAILTNGVSFVTAYGGGGGGGETAGHNGGSGGGGSKKYLDSTSSGVNNAGGSGISGQGYAGGAGDANNYGGGGGGAGGAGSPASASVHGVGGAGKTSDITGESVSYAPGGGGGCNNRNATEPSDGVAGGNNDEHGRGGVGRTVAPTAGQDGIGGGGGGANRNTAGAKGGDGVVYVRISMSMVGSLDKPTDPDPITYDGNAHTSIVSTAFFDVTGQNIGTNAGSYTATATLKPGCTWLDGSSDAATITMVIKPVAVALNSLSQAGWTYMDDPTPDPVCDFTADNPSSISLAYEYADSADAAEWSADKPVNAGTYYVRVRTTDEVNYEATPKSLVASFAISPVAVTFSNLRIRDWLYGTPDTDTPSPKCTVSPAWVDKVYEYADSADAETWSTTKPTAVGIHYLRVRAPDDQNYSYEAQVVPFKIVNGLGATFTDYVEITVDGWSGATPSELTNFPYKVTLSERASIGPYGEESLVGFLYERAGISGDDIAFTDEDGNVLCYYTESWQPAGDSTVYVKIPLIGADSQKIRLYWRLREGQLAPEHQPEEIWSDWTKDERDAVAQPSHSFGLVYKDGVWVNYFTQLPAMDKTTWAQGEPSGAVTTDAVLADGDVAVKVIDGSGAVLSTDPANLPTTPGTYRITFAPDDPDGEYEPISYSIDFRITGELPGDDLTGGLTGDYALTLNGRVMLANDDKADGHAVYGQAYWRTREVDIGDGTTLTNDVYWTHSGEHKHNQYAKLLDGTSHKLNYIGEDGATNVLWRLEDIIIGNGYRENGNLRTEQCALPWSSTSLGNSSYSNRTATNERLEAGNLIMRNSTSAVIYSPCYTNGIGTIYFDAVNWIEADSAKAENYRIVVEIATQTASGLEPTDENSAGADGSDFGNISTWKPCKMLPLKRDGGSTIFDAQAETNDLALAITTGHSSNNFYRVCVPVNCTGAVRFRIRRASFYSGYEADDYGLILLDNIIVSNPGCMASMYPYGIYDSERGGKQVLGQEAAMANVPFPSVGDAGNLLARGKSEAFVSPAAKGVDPATFVQGATFHYRWRYLGQVFDPADSGEWRSVALSPFDDYVATEALDIPSEPGDVEFWYELKTMMPFYSYYDYSGTDAKLGGLYTEEVTTVTNRMDTSAYTRLPSGGSDWFVRIREGASDLEAVNVVVSGAYKANQEMELISDHTWRGLVKVPSTNVSGTVSFLFQERNRQTAGSVEFAENETARYPTANAAKLPWRGEVSASGSAATYEADGASTYIEFTYNDASGTYSIGHAAYQNFNAWHDANLGSEKFVGTFAETSGVTTATMVQTNANMSAWTALVIEDSNWNEPFYLANYSDPGYPKGVAFGTHKMPGQWNGSNGMFVDASLAKNSEISKNSGIAWQMQGEEQGDVTFTQSDGPSGLDTLTFKARLGQSIGFDDFSVWYGDGSSSTNQYTIVVPALLSSSDTSSSVDFAPGASMSIVACYTPKNGCYEFRAEKVSTDGVQLSLYKWARSGYKIKSELLYSHWFSSAKFTSSEGATSPKLYAMVLSVDETAAGETMVIAGLSTAAYLPSDSYSSKNYNLIGYIDKTSTRLTKGAYGVLPKNCNGVFLHPRQYSSPLTRSKFYNPLVNAGGSGYFSETGAGKQLTFAGNYDYLPCRARLTDEWAYTPGRAEAYTNTAYGLTPFALGVCAPGNVDQTVDVYLKPRGAGSWPDEPFARQSVSSYSFSPHTVTVRTNANCDVMITAGEAPFDVAVWDIAQTSWNGADIDNIGNRQDDFVYTQARILQEIDGAKTNKTAMLQPARATAAKALSIRSPLLKGLGMIGFSYKDLKPGCEVWVQAATNSVVGNLTGTTGYNFSTNFVELGEAEVPPAGVDSAWPWITLRRYTYDELAAASAQTYYCGWHTHDKNPIVGMFRVVVAPSVVAAAQGYAMTDPEWGSITVTDVVVHDEPALDKSSWFGWNIRALGDDADTEKRMFLPDSMVVKSSEETSYGMSVGLNNSTSEGTVGDESEYDKVNPTIQSPTFGSYAVKDAETGVVSTNEATIGLVRFRARLYETNTASTAKGTVSLYGVMDGSSDDWGTALTNFTVDSFVYKSFEYRASSLRNFAAVRLVVDGVTNGVSGVERVLLDEVVVSERVTASVGFAYARPFRTGVNVDKEITNILDKDQQPLIDESWGVQAKLKFDKYDTEIDTNRGFRVYFRYFVGDSPWGYERWESESGASAWTELKQVGEYSDFIFRSSAANTASIVPSQPTANTVVQYMLYVQYYLAGSSDPQEQIIQLGAAEGDGWTNPSWYSPIDYNEDEFHGNGTYFSPYTILDGVSPGRVWINEVNYNDGPKAQTGNIKCETNQFIELAVPWGVDLKGWKVKLTDMNHRSLTIAELGKNGVPTSKKSTDGKRSGDYDFLVLQSPKTHDAGGIKDPETGLTAADGTWTSDSLSSTFKDGSLQYDEPYQLELFRPSGILEHQFVVAGTNEWREPAYYEAFGYQYDGTNLVNELNALDEAAGVPHDKRFYAGEDTARKANGITWSSLGVTGSAHGEEGGWSAEMKFTPGRLNEGQDELVDWYLKPNGASIWVYAQSLSPHVVQSIGDDTAQDTFVIVYSGMSTNISYAIDPWYAIGGLTVNGVTNAAATGATGTYTLNLNNITETTTVVVSGGVDPQLLAAGLDPADRYTPAVMNWLSARYAAGELANPEGPISLGHHKGLLDGDTVYEMPLYVMYWLDLDPTEPGWWMRHGFVGIEGAEIRRKRKWNNSYTEHFTNRQVRVKMYLSNDVSQVVYAPYRLQGLNNEQSDVFTGNWTSETFKVKVMLNNGLEHNVGFLPFRWFTFAPGSFGAKGEANEFESLIEILDPLARSSAGYSYGWYGQSCDSFLYSFSLDDSLGTGASVEVLKENSTYDGPPFEDDN